MPLDPIQLEVVAHALSGIAEEMGARLIRAAYSANIKERRDCSTALFDAQGRCIAQAAHIPVHLGALGDAVRAVMACQPLAGDVFLLNDPFQGGSHLPDLTVITAIPGLEPGQEPVGYAVNRAHHADVGGMAPGSMPAESTEIWQEGLIIPPVRVAQLIRHDLAEHDLAEHDLSGYQASGSHPSIYTCQWHEEILRLIMANLRQPQQRRGDLLAQAGANLWGVQRFQQVLQSYGSRLWSLIDGVLQTSAHRIRAQIKSWPDGCYEAEDYLEWVPDDIRIKVAITVADDRIQMDFAGTDQAIPGNLNAPLAVTHSAVLFGLRCLLDPELPSNSGFEDPIAITAPEGSVVNAPYPAAVVAGNVETSQRIADLIFKALAPIAGKRAIAQGQGTMNNLILGNRHFSYYETLGGGQGASMQGSGASGIHVGMSNTLNTPIEALEITYPLRILRYQLRSGSGGAGSQFGGKGVIRTIQVLEDCTLSLLTERRQRAPQGSAGGQPAQVGENHLNDAKIPSKVTRSLKAGDTLTLLTPGGGGWGLLDKHLDSPDSNNSDPLP